MKKSTSSLFTRFLLLFVLICMIVSIPVSAQMQEIPLHRETYKLSSDAHSGDQSGDKLVFSAVVEASGAPWLSIHFGAFNLGKNSYIIMTSQYDNKWQKHNQLTLTQWYNYSAFFNGDAVKIELYAAPGDQNISFTIDELVVGDWFVPTDSQCGPTDDRIPSNDPAVGRIVSIGCTGWIIPNGSIVTAGHCLDATTANILEFNIPLSSSGGTINHPGPEDQYSIDQSSRVFVNGGIGNDFGVCKVFANPVTGLMPKEKQDAYFTLVQDLGPATIRITGCGVDDGTANQTLQTHSGPNAGSSGTTMRYVVDTEGGNSGSPVIDESTHFALGVHTHGGCTTSGGNNSGTSFFHTDFWEAVEFGSGGCGIEVASNPVPSNSSTDISTELASLQWTNGTDAVSNELYFGTDPGSMVLVQSGTLAVGWNVTPSPLTYSTTYFWQVVEIGDTCSSPGPLWSFTTVQDPSLVTLFFDDFESGTGLWTISNDGGSCVWEIFNPPYPNSYTLPCINCGGVLAADADECGSGTSLLSTAEVTNPIDASQYQTVILEWDNDWNALGSSDFAYVDVSTDGGTTWQNVVTFDAADVTNTHESYNISSMAALQTFMLRFKSVQPGWDWWWAVDNVKVLASDVIPVELSSFTVLADQGNVVLSWTTATETNNRGFEIERKSADKEYQKAGYVPGFGTTSHSKSYTYTDKNLASGNYTYRLKQIDLDGSSKYSNEMEAEVVVPARFSLEQNYPNPFNPVTTIKYSIPASGIVTLAVYDLLGQEAATLVNENQQAGTYSVEFNASSLSSGIYMYKLTSGTLVETKKLMLLK